MVCIVIDNHTCHHSDSCASGVHNILIAVMARIVADYRREKSTFFCEDFKLAAPLSFLRGRLGRKKLKLKISNLYLYQVKVVFKHTYVGQSSAR